MIMDLKTRALTRISLAALVLTLLAGVFAGSVLTRADDDAVVDNPVKLDDDTQKAVDEAVKKALIQAEQGKPAPRRTAYVDFLKLLKNDQPLRREQLRIATDMQKDQDAIDRMWEGEILKQKNLRAINKPHTKAYRDAMREQLEHEKERYQQKLHSEQVFREELRDKGIERFKELKQLATKMAKDLGYNELLNIVNVDDVAKTRDDFEALQQQLLVSPVLYFEAEHNLTDVIQAAAKDKWDEHITLAEYNKEKNTGGIELTLEGGAAALTRNAAGEIEIKLGQKGAFKVAVFDKGQPAEGARADVRFYKRGFGVGDLNENGTYTAPEAMPAGGATFEVTVRSAIDPTVEQKVTIRLLEK
jgi:hypothetical protein